MRSYLALVGCMVANTITTWATKNHTQMQTFVQMQILSMITLIYLNQVKAK